MPRTILYDNIVQYASSHETRIENGTSEYCNGLIRGFVNGSRTSDRGSSAREETFEETGRDVTLLKIGVVEDAFV